MQTIKINQGINDPLFVFQFQHVSNLFQFILVAIYIAVPLIEVIRLYIGHIGNTEEKVGYREICRRVCLIVIRYTVIL